VTAAADEVRGEIAAALREALSGQSFSAGQGGLVLNPDPTKLTTDAVDRATAEWARELRSAVAIIETRLDGNDQATKINADRIERIPEATDAARVHLRGDIDRQVQALRELVFGKLDAIDAASKLLANGLEKFPTDLDRSAAAVREYAMAQIQLARAETERVRDVMQEKFDKVDAQFVSNDKALTAALAAQEKAAAEQQKSNTLAIDKSERATQETIRANQAQIQTSIESQGATINDLKERLVRLEAGGIATAVGRGEARADNTYSQSERIASNATVRANISLAIAGIVGILGLALSVFAIVHG
jgi:hypothetical protein